MAVVTVAVIRGTAVCTTIDCHAPRRPGADRQGNRLYGGRLSRSELFFALQPRWSFLRSYPTTSRMKQPTGFRHFCAGILALIFLLFGSPKLSAAETGPAVSAPPDSPPSIPEPPGLTNSQDELRLGQQAIDQLRREIEQ